MDCNNYYADEGIVEQVSNANFHICSHDNYEIYLFIEGDSKYVVEENVYSLQPGDMIIIRKNEMHRVYHNTSGKYHRFVIRVTPGFFNQKNCPEYEKVFLENTTVGNKIDSELVRSSGLYDAIMRLKKYSHNFTVGDTPITDSIMVEILYILNHISTFTVSDVSTSSAKEIISYINDNFTKDISLDFLANKFFLSKYHICHSFKNATGLTVQNYIKEKRLMYAREIYSKGVTLSEAAAKAGFKDYSSFYRTFTKKYNVSPKTDSKYIK